MSIEKYKSFWSQKTNSGLIPSNLSNKEKEFFLGAHVNEIKALIGQTKNYRILEAGCGDGLLYEKLFVDCEYYKGIDFSENLLSIFRKRKPRLDLFEADASTYSDGNTYDIIFSNQLIQYLDESNLMNFLKNMSTMLDKKSRIICCGIPNVNRKFAYQTQGSFIKGLFRYLFRKIRDPMGYWYSKERIKQLCQSLNLKAEFKDSQSFFYRFNAVIRKN